MTIMREMLLRLTTWNVAQNETKKRKKKKRYARGTISSPNSNAD